jgi:hypothetical protein
MGDAWEGVLKAAARGFVKACPDDLRCLLSGVCGAVGRGQALSAVPPDGED